MAANMCKLRAIFKARNSFLLQNKILSSNHKYFADDATKKDNLYETLGITSTATPNEIKKAYYDLTFKYHPDKNKNCKIAATKFREVSEAYEILGNYGFRKKYDKGVPVPDVKKAIRRAHVAHSAKYQEFFDSRTAQSTSTKRDEEINELSRRSQGNTERDIDAENAASLRTTQLIITVYFCVLIYWRYG